MSYKSLLIIIVFLLIPIVFLLRLQTHPKTVSAEWFNDSWTYRQAINISSSSNQTNFQISLSVGTSSLIAADKMQSDCDDIRLTDQNGQLLSHWIETGTYACNTTNTRIWVKVPSLFTSGTNIFLYYGNASASSTQNGDQVFEFFDDFNGTSLNTNKWTQASGGTNTLTIASGEAELYASSGYIQLTGNTNIGSSSIVEQRVKFTSVCAADRNRFGPGRAGGSDSGIFSNPNMQIYWAAWVGTTVPTTDYYYLQRINTGTTFTWNVIRSTGTTHYTNSATSNLTSPQYVSITVGDSPGSNCGHMDTDWIFARKYTSTTPTSTASTEETGPGPIAYWKFDEGVGTTVYDASGHNFNGSFGTDSSAPTWITEDQCVNGKCLKFDGNDSISVSSITTTNWTTSLWLRVTQLPSVAGFLITKDSYSMDGSVLSSGKLRLQTQAGGDYIDSNTTLNTNQWYFVTFQADDSKIYIYINGQLDNSATKNKVTGSGNILIGKRSDGYIFTGFLDDIKIYPYARTAAQIREDYNASATNIGSAPSKLKANSDGLVGYWKMDEGVGTTTLDSSGNGYTATLAGSTAPSWATGKYGNSIDLDYAGYGEFTDIAFGTTSPWTASFWIYPNNTKNNIPLGRGTQSSYVRAYVNGASSSLAVRNTAAETETAVTVTMNTGTWYMVTATADGTGQAKMYLNGQYVGLSNPGASGTPITFDRFGTAYPGNINFSIDAKMDEIRIYNRALSNSEVLDLYNYAPGPIAHWKFDEGVGTTAYDSSSNGNNASFGTGSSAPTWTNGKIGKALSFDGSNDYVSLASNISPGQNATYCAWAKWNTGDGAVMGQTTAGRYVLLTYSSGTQIYSMNDSGSQDYWTYTMNNNWHYLCMTLSTNTTVQLYIDGISQGTKTLTAGGFTIGTIGRGSTYFYNGIIDDVKIYNYARTQSQILQDMGSQNAPGTQTKLGSPLVHYKFDEGRGTTANNSGIGGTLNGTFGSGTSAPTWTTSGKFGNALSFDGSNSYISLGNNNALSITGDLTISAWIKPTSVSSTYEIIGRQTYVREYAMGITANEIYLIFGDGSSFNANYLSIGASLTANTWQQVTAVRDTTKLIERFYVNGKYISQNTYSVGVSSSSNFTEIGRRDASNYKFSGLIDDVKIYNYALTPDEVKQDYNRGSSFVAGSTNQTIGSTTTSLDYCIPGDTSACSPPIAEWEMDEGNGSIIYDTSGTGNTGAFGSGSSAPTWTSGKTGAGLSFDGVDDYINATGLNVTGGNYTFEFWAKPDTIHSSTSDFFIDIETGRFVLGRNSNKYQFYDGSWKDYGSGVSYSPYINSWHHYAFIFNASNTTTYLYIDGVLLGSNSTYSSKNIGGTIALMSRYNNTTYQQKGYLDQFKIYNYARTPAQVALDYNRGGPAGWWKLDECQGSVAYDSSGIGNTGTITIGASGSQNTLGTCQVGTSAAWTTGATGKWNSSLNFDGTDDYISVADTSSLSPTTSVTVSGWVKSSTGGSTIGVITKGVSGNEYDYMLYFTSSGSSVDFYIKNSSGTADNIGNYSLNWADSTWHHYVATFDGDLMKLYIDGLLKSSKDTSLTNIRDSANPLQIGKGYTSQLNGQIDDVRIYNYALTAEQIRQLYNGGAVNFR